MPRTVRPSATPGTQELAAILDRVALPVWVVDDNGFVLFVNPAGLAALGYDELAELRGRPGHETIHYKRADGSPYPAEECPMTRVRGMGVTVREEDDWFIRRDGSMFPVSYTSTPIDLPGGQGAVVAFQDMGEQREAEQALRERETILATVDQPVWVLDHAGDFHYLNPAAVAALGYDDASELLGRPAHETVHYKRPDGSPYPLEECTLAQARMRGETAHELDDWLVRKDGSLMPVTFSMSPFELPDGLGSVTAFSDVEERRRAERAARERDVAEARSEELQAARRRVIEAGDAARARLERDLHDGAQQAFVSAVLNLRFAERLEAKDPEQAGALRATGIELAESGLAELRRLAAGIHPAVLTDHGLGPAVEALAARLPLVVSVENETPDRLPAPVEASVYFFVCEALTNTVKHANAGEARVRIATADHELSVEVADDGVGGAEARNGGTGLRGLGDRVGALDGALELLSPPNGGTLLRARIPLPPG
jgi:PAS domain S-box-containing protein